MGSKYVKIEEDEELIYIHEIHTPNSRFLDHVINWSISASWGFSVDKTLKGKRLGAAIAKDKSTHEIKAECIYLLFRGGIEAICDGNPYYIPLLAKRYGASTITSTRRLDKIFPEAALKNEIKIKKKKIYVFQLPQS